MTSIDTRVFADPAACARAAEALALTATRVAAAADVLAGTPARIARGMDGETANSYARQAQGTARNLDALEQQIGEVQRAVAAFGSSLQSITADMAALRSSAAATGLSVTGESIEAPPMPAQGADDATVLAHNDKVAAFNALAPQADHLRWRETQAHDLFESSLDKAKHLNPLAWFLDKAGLIPPDHGDPVQDTVFGLGLGGNLASWAATWLGKTRLTTFKPRWPAGSTVGKPGAFRPKDGLSLWESFRLAGKDVSWVAKSGKAGTNSAWGTVEDVAGKAGVVFAAFSGGYDQYQKDADDKSLSGVAKGTRTGTTAVTTGAGAWAGAELGGQAGAGIGFLIGGPPGAAVGAVVGGVGGVVGGFAGTQAGQWLGDKLSDAAGDVGDAVADGVKDAGGWLKDHNPFGWP